MKDPQLAERLRAQARCLREIAAMMTTRQTASALNSKADSYIARATKLDGVMVESVP